MIPSLDLLLYYKFCLLPWIISVLNIIHLFNKIQYTKNMVSKTVFCSGWKTSKIYAFFDPLTRTKFCVLML